jgi:hypothetical protein
MHRFSPFLFLIVISAPSMAQSFDKTQSEVLIKITRYCVNVEDYSDSQVPRLFARTTSAYGQSTGWVEFDSRAAWRRAGRPKPVALVWYRDARIVRVAVSAKDDVYADYCYRQDGTLARLRSVPSERQQCEPSRNQCTVVLREVRFYPPNSPVLKAYGDLDGLAEMPNEPIVGARTAERVIQMFLPMNWPEYSHVTDLPFNVGGTSLAFGGAQ